MGNQYSLYAGAANFDAFVMYSKTRKTNIFFLLHISRVGLEKAGCASDEGEFVRAVSSIRLGIDYISTGVGDIYYAFLDYCAPINHG